MHDCQRFREELLCLIEQARPGDLCPECSDCRQYASEAAALFVHLENLRLDVPNLPPDYWTGFNSRLKRALIEEASACRQFSDYWGGTLGAVLACAAALIIAVSAIAWRATQTIAAQDVIASQVAQPPAQVRVVDDHLDGLDEEVVRFLGQSEMFLRNFTKITPTNIEDIEDARSRAVQQLAGLGDRREAAQDFVPVRIVLDEYETVLRDIENLEPNASIADDIADIQGRIQQNGLIAGLKTYQPRIEMLLQGGR
jgi:hypothetical protein